MTQKKLFLLDGMALIYRAFFAFSSNHRYNSAGLNTSAMFGFANTLLEVLQKEKPTHIAVVFDTSAPTERHIIYPEYKAQRESMPEDLAASIPYIFKLIEGFRIPVLTLDGYEADDIIGTLAWKAAEKGFITYMMTPDKDFAQLVKDNVFIFKPARMGNGAEVLDVASVLEKWEVQSPSQVIDILALWGDAVDNIPGIPGIGEKTAKKLIATYGSVEQLIEKSDELTGALHQKVKTYGEQGLLSKKLATIDVNVPIELDELSLTLDPPDMDKLEEVFKELEFRSMAKRVLGLQAKEAPIQHDLFSSMANSTHQSINTQADDESNFEVFSSYDPEKQMYSLIDTIEGVTQLVKELSEVETFCFDTETDGIDPIVAEAIGIAFCAKAGKAAYIDLNHEHRAAFIALIKPLFKSNQVKVAQNLKFDLLVLENAGIHIEGPCFDTMLAHYLLEPDKRHNMDELSRTYLKYDPISIEKLIGPKGKDQRNMKDLPAESIFAYAAEDTDVTFQLMLLFKPLLNERGLDEVFYQIEMPLVPVLAQMERNGVTIDSDFLQSYSDELSADIAQIEKQIYEVAGMQFNIASPKQLGEVLFDKLKLMDKPKKTKTGQYQTNEEILQKLSNKHPIVELILDYRELVKLKSTYVDALPLLVMKETGRIHTSFNQAVAATGRLSSTNPNLQNIPIRTNKGRHIRKAFIARDAAHKILSADYSQIELRIIAAVSQDPHMQEAFIQQQDIHTATAAKVFGVKYEEVTKEMRSKAKTVNFGIIYGISAFGLSERMGISRSEAKVIIDEYFNKFPGIKSYMESSIQHAKSLGYVTTLRGRRRYVPDIHSQNQTVRGFAERNAINAPIQGSAADMIKLAMIAVQNELNKRKLKSRLLMQVHDELVLDVPIEEIDEVKQLVIEQMRDAMPISVPVLVEAGVGDNWLEAH